MFFAILFYIANSSFVYSQWQLTGNSGTNQSVNFVGTTDAQQLVFRTNNIIRMRIGTNLGSINQGVVSIGNIDPDNTPYGGTLRIKGSDALTAIDLVRSPNNLNGWENQIRFYNYNNLRHVIADDYLSGKLVLQTNVDPNSGSVDIFDIRGRVQIGNGTAPTPSGYNLYVENGILAEKVKVALKSSGDWSDYVFYKNYKLMPVQSVEKFIIANYHLPGMPSSEEVVKDGIDLAKMDAMLLQKIEELTLYIIDLKKQSEALEKRIKKLELHKN